MHSGIWSVLWQQGCSLCPPGGGVSGVEGGSHDEEGDKDRKSRKNRCHSCRKRVGLTGTVISDVCDWVAA